MVDNIRPAVADGNEEFTGLPEFDVRPVTLPKRSLASAAGRTLHIWALGARHLTPEFAKRVMRRGGNPARGARRVAEKLGSTYIKFGQFAASAPGIVGDSVAEEFRDCLDTGPAVPFSYVKSMIESELGRPIGEMFATLAETPLAAASIAVVHKATLLDGTPVVVKVLSTQHRGNGGNRHLDAGRFLAIYGGAWLRSGLQHGFAGGRFTDANHGGA